MVIVRIEHFHNRFGQILLLHCLLVISPVKGIQIEGVNRLRIPDPQGIDHVVSIADHRQIIGHSSHRLVSFLDKTIHAVPVFNAHITAEFYLYGILRAADLKGIAVLQPVIRHLHLIAIFNLLLKHTIAIANAAAIGRISQSCQRIEKAGGQAAQTAVSKGCIRLLILNGV